MSACTAGVGGRCGSVQGFECHSPTLLQTRPRTVQGRGMLEAVGGVGGEFLCCPQRSGWTPVSSVGLQPSTFSSSSSSDSCFCFVFWTCSLTFILKYHTNHHQIKCCSKRKNCDRHLVKFQKDRPCIVVFVTINTAEDIELEKKIQILLLSKSKRLHPWCSTEVLMGVEHLHVAPKLQSAATPVDQSPSLDVSKCHRGPAMFHLSHKSTAGVLGIFPFPVWPCPYWCRHT